MTRATAEDRLQVAVARGVPTALDTTLRPSWALALVSIQSP